MAHDPDGDTQQVIEDGFANPTVIAVQSLREPERPVQHRLLGLGEGGDLELEPLAQTLLSVDLGDDVQREGMEVPRRQLVMVQIDLIDDFVDPSVMKPSQGRYGAIASISSPGGGSSLQPNVSFHVRNQLCVPAGTVTGET